jgi:hypothetical protein
MKPIEITSSVEFKIVGNKIIISQSVPTDGQIVLPLEDVPGFVDMLVNYISQKVQKKIQSQCKTPP